MIVDYQGQGAKYFFTFPGQKAKTSKSNFKVRLA